MSPAQIFALAKHVEAVVKEFKDDTYFTRNRDFLELWEDKLKHLINEDKVLPDYNIIDTLVLEFLLSHYESEVHCTRGESWDDNEPVG